MRQQQKTKINYPFFGVKLGVQGYQSSHRSFLLQMSTITTLDFDDKFFYGFQEGLAINLHNFISKIQWKQKCSSWAGCSSGMIGTPIHVHIEFQKSVKFCFEGQDSNYNPRIEIQAPINILQVSRLDYRRRMMISLDP